MVAGGTQEQAALSAGVSPKTVWRWLAYDVDFAASIKDHSSMALYDARRQLVTNLETAVSCMVQIVNSEKPSAGSGVKLRAAIMIIDLALRLVETTDILERLKAIEAKLAGGQYDTRSN